MIPKKLTLQGIYSYQQKQTIDFETLTHAGLFGIFGSVGCGKSTILEAISFALFGQSERLNARDNRNYNMMNLKSNELYIDFEFASGEKDYRFIVHGKRNSKKFEDVKKLDRTAYQLKNDTWEPISEEMAEEITGLNYNNFHRTIIIPQGKFQEFLQLTAKDRTNMLRELFNLNKFELYGRVADIERNNDQRLQNLKGQLENIGTIDPEEIKKLETQLKVTSEELKKANDELKKIQKQIKEQEGIRDLHKKLSESKLLQEKLLKEKEVIDRLEKELKEYETLTRVFRSPLEQVNRLTKDREKIEGEQKQAKEQLQKLQGQYTKLTEAFNQTRKLWEQREKWLREADELEKMADIRKLKTDIEKELERQKKGNQMVQQNLDVLEGLKKRQKSIKEDLAKKKEALPDLKILSDVRDWFSQFKQLEKEQKETRRLQKETDEAEKLIQQQLLEIAEKYSVAQAQTTVDFINSLQVTVAKNKKHLEEEKTKLEAEWHHLQVQQQLQKYAYELEDGKPCPLCGSEHHPHILKADDLSAKLQVIEESRQKSQKQITQLTEAETSLLRLTDRYDSLNKERKKQIEHQEQLTEQIKQHKEKFQWEKFSPEKEDKVTEAFKQHEIISKEIKKLETDQEKINSDTEKAEKNKEDYRKLLDEIERSIVEKKSRIETLSGQFREVNPEQLKKISSDELTQKAAGLKKQHAEIGERYQKEEKEVANIGKELDTLKGRIETRQQHLEQTQKELTVLNEQIETLLKEHGNLQRKKVSEVVFKPFEIDATRKKIDQYKQDLNSNTNTIKQYEEELDGRTFDEKKYLELTQDNQKLNKTIEDLNRAWGEANTSLTRLKKDQQKAKELKKEHDKVQERAEDLKMMKNLFKGGAFVNYISTVYLQELVRAANDRFYRLTRQHLSLELAPDNSFQVRDYMNEGHLRSVKTLSGGQTFQASLSLALALADSIQKHTSTSGNFFFLDEGFGTLDRESLNIVFDTLKSLRHENRIVGVISHVEDMQQEISTYLHIKNQEGKGSIVNASWEQ
ncbi:AAA family ATPase [Marinilabilia rubra]|uniref:Rad50/SbcC-type AAA domain-containing protein n=1 Tax=Marinilabilia rubra TaxID=2162893 RepID=A0A2U2B6E7_9BACT|nr:AAA family ATPase [Marinilabilia rubra]PWD98650.1 hypothetical protein DDZ16_14410 [Marinilabilia rubra]